MKKTVLWLTAISFMFFLVSLINTMYYFGLTTITSELLIRVELFTVFFNTVIFFICIVLSIKLILKEKKAFYLITLLAPIAFVGFCWYSFFLRLLDTILNA